MSLGLKLGLNLGSRVGARLAQLLVYQFRCTKVDNTAMPVVSTDITNSFLLANHVIRLVGTGATTLQLPLAVGAPHGSRVIVFNHNSVEVSVLGTRNASVELTESVKTNAPYFEVIVEKGNEDSAYANFQVITSA